MVMLDQLNHLSLTYPLPLRGLHNFLTDPHLTFRLSDSEVVIFRSGVIISVMISITTNDIDYLSIMMILVAILLSSNKIQ